MRPQRISAPHDLEQVFGGLSGLDACSHYADTFRQSHDVDDAGHLPRLRLIHGLGPSARIGRLQHRSVDHAGHLDIHAVFGGAGNLEWHFDPRYILADEAELRSWLEVLVPDLRQFGWRLRKGRDLAITDAPVRSPVDHNTRLGRKLGRRHAPFRRDGIDEDAPRLGAGNAHRLEIAARRHAGRGLEVTVETRIAVFLLIPFGRID